MKWLFVGMLYVALDAAAFGQAHWAWADALWLASFLAICYAAALAFNARGGRQSRAVGFLIGGALFATVIHFSNDGGPLGRLVMPNPWVAYPVIQAYSPPAGYVPPMIASGTFSATPTTSPTTGTLSVVTAPRAAQPTTPSPYASLPVATIDWESRLRAANAIGVMAAGVIGAILSAVAYRQSHSTTDAD